MPRTTLHLEDDAAGIAKAYSVRHGVSLGESVSELVRRGAERSVETEVKNGLRVLRLAKRSPRVTSARVRDLHEDQI